MDPATGTIISMVITLVENILATLAGLKNGTIDPKTVDLAALRASLIAMPDLPEEPKT